MLPGAVALQAASDTWSGSLSSTWDTSTLNWNSGVSHFTSGDDALFTGTPANNVTVATGLTIGAITLDSTFTGSVALTGNNTMSAATTIGGGTLSLTTVTGLGTSAVTVNSPGALALNASTAADITYANTVAGAGKIQFLYSATGAHDIFLNNLGSFTGTIELSLGSGQANTGGKARLYGATLSGTSSLIIDSGTQLYMGGGNVTLAGIQVQGTGNSEARGAIRSQSGILAGPISLMADTTIGTEGGTISGNISSGASGTQTLTLGTSASTGNLTLSGNLGGGTGTMALTKTQAGTTTMSGVNTYTGGTTISAGTLTIGGSGSLGSGSYSAGITDNGAFNFNSSASQTLSGIISGTGSVTDSGTGALTLSGVNTYTGTTTVSAGTLNYSGTLGISPATAAAAISVGVAGGGNATLNIQSGANIRMNSVNLLAGNGTTVPVGDGFVFQGGGTITGMNQLQLGAGASGASYGYYNLSGSASISMSEFDLGSFNGAAVGVLDMSGGTMNVSAWCVPSRGTGGTGILNLTGGTFNFTGAAGQFSANWNGGTVGTAVINVTNASLIASPADVNMMQTGGSGKLGEINLLSGGLMQAHSIAPGSATGTSSVNFNGGTLKANTTTTTFITANNTAVNVYGGGGTIDNNGVTITIPKALSAPAGNGINSAVTITAGGSGYVGAPAVTFSSGGGVGAAGYATISGGAVTGIVITSPGTGYTSVPTVTLTGGGYTSAATATAPTPTANTSGGMTFQGSGTTILTASSTYSGGTTISAGTVQLQANGSGQVLNGSELGTGAVTNNGGTLYFFPVGSATAVNYAQNFVFNGGTISSEDGFPRLATGAGATINVTSATTLQRKWGHVTGKYLALDGILQGSSPLTLQGFGGATTEGAAIWINNANNTYSGTITVNANTGTGGFAMVDGANNALQNTTVNLSGTRTSGSTDAALLYGVQFASGVTAPAFGALAGNGNINLMDLSGTPVAVALTVGGNGASTTNSGVLSGSGSLTKVGVGTMTLSGANTYTGDTTISGGTLALSGSGALASPNIIVNSGKMFDVSAISYTMAASQTLRGFGNVNGNVTLNNSTSFIKPGTSASVGTNTFNNNLTMTSGGATFRLSTSASSGNDQTIVTGNLTIGNGDTIHISALSGAANLDTIVTNYVLFSVSGTTTMSTTPSLTWDGTTPANYLNYSIHKVGQNVVLQYAPASAPTVVATSSPATVTRNQTITVTVTVTPGSPGSVTNVQINASAIGGSSTATLVLSATANVYTNTFTVASNTAPGVVTMPVIAIDNTPLTSPAYNVTNTIVATNEVWTGLGGNNNWSTSPNWNTTAPAASGDAVTFAGSTQTNPNLDNNYSVTGVTFDSTAASFTLATANSSALTLAGGMTNNSANTQTINVPVTMNTTQPINASAGNLAFGQNIANGGNTITFTGSSNTTVSGAVSGSGALTASGSGAVTLAGANTYSGTTTVSAGTLALSGSGTLGASTAAVTVSGGTLNLGATSQNSGTATVSGGTLTNGTLTVTNLALQSGTVSAVLAGTSIPVSKTTAGAITLSGANTYSGTTTVSAGTLNLNHAAALGTSTLAISGGALDNTSGVTVTLNNNLQSWNGDFTFAGTTNLNLGTGAVTPNASRTVTVSANNLTVGGSIGGGAVGLTKAGNGTLTLSAATNTFTGQLLVNGGTLVWNSAAALAPSAGDFQPLFVQSGGALTVNGSLKYSSGTAGVNGYLQAGGSGAGNIGTLTINSGGSLTFTNQTGNPNSVVGQFGTGGTSSINVNGGAFNWDGTGGLFIGNAGGNGELLITNGGTATILKGIGTSDEGYLAIGRNSSTSTGMVYLATGTLATDRVIARGTATPIGVGYVCFDGGTLKALANQSDWLQAAVSGNANPPNAVTIADGGAKIDANGFSVAINNNLLHGGVAATDGGLTLISSSGTGTLTLGGANTYTGNTTISAGSLALSGSGSIANTANIIIGGGAKFDVTGLSSTFALGSGQTLTNISGTGIIAGNVNLASGALALSYTNGTPSLSVTNGTLAFNGNAVTVAVAGSLPHGIYKLISTNSGGLVSGTLPSSVTVNGIGTATASLSIANGELYLTVNHPPVAGNMVVTRNAGINSMRILVSDLLTNVTDADGDTITLVGFGNSTNGVFVTTTGTNYLNYYNTNNVNDQFSYTVTDGFGGTNTGLVSIVVSNAATGQITGQLTSFTGGVANLTFHGIPNYSYITERSTNLTDWVDVVTNNAATNGVISVTDSFGDLGGVPASAYYRLKWQP